MAPPKPLYATGIFVFGCACLILGCIALYLPNWGHFESRHGGYQAERGYFGPWKVCKTLNYGREICGNRLRIQVSALLALSATILFVVEINSATQDFIITRAIPFYLQIVYVVLSFGLASIALYDVIYTFRSSGVPGVSVAATTVNNPGYSMSGRI